MTAIHYIDGTWIEGDPPILGPLTHATWMASVVFDGARAFEGVAPDLDRHCQRLIDSANSFGLRPVVSAGEVQEIAEDGRARFAKDAALYIRPMFWAEKGAGKFYVMPDPESTRFCCTLFEAPMAEPEGRRNREDGGGDRCGDRQLDVFAEAVEDAGRTDPVVGISEPRKDVSQEFDHAVALRRDQGVARCWIPTSVRSTATASATETTVPTTIWVVPMGE